MSDRRHHIRAADSTQVHDATLFVEIMAAGCVRLGGGEFIGFQETLRSKWDIVLFNDPATDTTLALPLAGLNPEKVREKIAAHMEGGQHD